MSISVFPFDNSYARLPAHFFSAVRPTAVEAPRLVKLNVELARQLGLDPDALASPEGVAILSGREIAHGSEPIAAVYAGHQFGHFSPQLGDGRAILLGEVVDRSGLRRDIQLKGSGPTPYSRRGDGRAALGPVLREYLISEAMAALGVPTTRALAAVTTGEHVVRETLLPGAVLTRVASSHIRVGSFQFFASRGNTEAVCTLADHAIGRHYPEIANTPDRYQGFLKAVVARQAALVVRWLLLGFIHGVMNTDNMSVSGETIDYGPCAFMDAYDPATVFSSIDQFGRYAYANQPAIAQWNLTRLAECLVPLFAPDQDKAIEQAQAILAGFAETFNAAYADGMRRKLGLLQAQDDDLALAQDLLDRMAANKTDFTLFFRRLIDAAAGPDGDAAVRDLFIDPTTYDPWAARWRQRLAAEPTGLSARQAAMRAANPAFIPRNHRVEALIEAAVERGDYQPFEEFLAVLAHPYEDQPAFAHYAEPPPPDQGVYRTFCGT